MEIFRFGCMMVLFDGGERGNARPAAAALVFPLLRKKPASLGTKGRSEKAALPAIFRLSLLSMSSGTQRCSYFSLHAQHKQGKKPRGRKRSGYSVRLRGTSPSDLRSAMWPPPTGHK